MGYRYTTQVEELHEKLDLNSDEHAVKVPIMVRGQIIGTVSLRPGSGQNFSDDEMDIIRATVERAAIAAENARLLDDSQRRAVKEQTITDITSKISASVNMESILQTAVEELGKTLSGAQVSIRLVGNKK